MLVIRTFEESDREAVIALWNECGLTRSWNDPNKDIDRKLDDSGDLFFVVEIDGDVMGAVMAGYDGHRGWVNYLAVRPSAQRQSIGRQLMDHCETVLQELGCPKLNLQIRNTNHAVIAFYEQLGYTSDDCVSMGKRLIADE